LSFFPVHPKREGNERNLPTGTNKRSHFFKSEILNQFDHVDGDWVNKTAIRKMLGGIRAPSLHKIQTKTTMKNHYPASRQAVDFLIGGQEVSRDERILFFPVSCRPSS